MSSRVLTVGETMGLAVNDRPGPLAASRPHTMSFGGAESNVAIALTRLGIPTTWVSRIGADPFGELITRELRAEGVDVRASIDPTRVTGFMHKHRRTHDTANVTFWRAGSAASGITTADIPDELLESVELVHVTGIFPGLSPSTQACTLELLRRAKSAGITVSFDINHRTKVWGENDAADVYRHILAMSDIVFAGDAEAALVASEGTPHELADKLGQLGPTECVIKLGGDGAIATAKGHLHTQQAYKVDVVDTVGAGDAFVAGYLSSYLDGGDVPERLQRGAAAGAYACTVAGDWEGAPTLAELSTFGKAEGIER